MNINTSKYPSENIALIIEFIFVFDTRLLKNRHK